MLEDSFQITTKRLRLRAWRGSDRDEFAEMNADPNVMADLGGPLMRAASDDKLDRYTSAYEMHGFTRWVVERGDGGFLGCVGVMPAGEDHPLGAHYEIGWRLARDAWGHGYATEAATAALDDIFGRIGLTEVLASTAADNERSQQVMQRLGMERRASRDFTTFYEGLGTWSGLVWATTVGSWATSTPRCSSPRIASTIACAFECLDGVGLDHPDIGSGGSAALG